MCWHYNNKAVHLSNLFMVSLNFEPLNSQLGIPLAQLGHGLNVFKSADTKYPLLLGLQSFATIIPPFKLMPLGIPNRIVVVKSKSRSEFDRRLPTIQIPTIKIESTITMSI